MGHLRRQCVKENDEDDSRAISYIQKSAVKDWPPAMIQLALYYIEKAEKDPEETTKNLETAYFWPEKARILKDSQAEVLLKEIKKKKEKLEEDFSEVTSEFAECLNMIETVTIEIKKENNKDLNLIT
jgi:hypothetical protein